MLKAGAEASADDIRAFVKERVAAYKYPRKIWFSDELPKGPTGKILKREIKAPAVASRRGLALQAAPQAAQCARAHAALPVAGRAGGDRSRARSPRSGAPGDRIGAERALAAADAPARRAAGEVALEPDEREQRRLMPASAITSGPISSRSISSPR